MKVKDFEKAIKALGDITLDGMYLRGGHVRKCLAHKEHTLLQFDAFGRAFGIEVPYVIDDREDHHVYDEDEYKLRLPDFDLKFV